MLVGINIDVKLLSYVDNILYLCGFQHSISIFLGNQKFSNQLTIHDWQVDLTPWNLALIGRVGPRVVLPVRHLKDLLDIQKIKVTFKTMPINPGFQMNSQNHSLNKTKSISFLLDFYGIFDNAHVWVPTRAVSNVVPNPIDPGWW